MWRKRDATCISGLRSSVAVCLWGIFARSPNPVVDKSKSIISPLSWRAAMATQETFPGRVSTGSGLRELRFWKTGWVPNGEAPSSSNIFALAVLPKEHASLRKCVPLELSVRFSCWVDELASLQLGLQFLQFRCFVMFSETTGHVVRPSPCNLRQSLNCCTMWLLIIVVHRVLAAPQSGQESASTPGLDPAMPFDRLRNRSSASRNLLFLSFKLSPLQRQKLV